MKNTRRSFICALLVIVFTLSFSVSALAAPGGQSGQDVTFVSGGLRYRVIDGGNAAEVINLVSGDTKVTIPETAEGLPVTAIGKSAFAGTPVQRVTLGSNVKSIGVQAFQGCKDLCGVLAASDNNPNSVTSVTSIDTSAFSGCSSLTEVSFPSVTKLGASAFQKCTALSTANFSKLTDVKSQTFHGCTALDSEKCDFGSVKTVETGAFQNCSKITALDNSFKELKNVGNSSFAGTGLTRIVNKPTIEKIGESAFYGCEKLETISLPASVKRIDRAAFGGCTALKGVSLAYTDALELIQEDVFSGTSFDPKTNGGLGYTAVIEFDGTKEEWDRVTRGKYSDYNVSCSDDQTAWNPGVGPAPTPTLNGDTAPPEYSEGLVPDIDEDWAKLSNYKPESGDEIKLITKASKGTISFTVSEDFAYGSSLDYKILYPDKTIILDASNPGTGFQRSTYELPIKVSGRAGDKITITLNGTYTNGSTSLPFSFTLPEIEVQGTLRLTGINDDGSEFELINIGPTDAVRIKAVIGPPPEVTSYSWVIQKRIDGGWKVAQDGTLSLSEDPAVIIFRPGAGKINDDSPEAEKLKAVGLYRITCIVKANGETRPPKTVEIEVSEKKPKIYPQEKALRNLQPGKSASLHMKWLENSAPIYDSIEYSWSCYPNQSALSGNLKTALATFCATEPGVYTVTCTARVTVRNDPSRGYTTSDTVKIAVYPYALKLTDDTSKKESIGTAKEPSDVLTAGSDSRKITAEWINQTTGDPLNPDTGTVTYTWQCLAGGVNRSEALKDALPGTEEVTFAPKVDGNYTITCVSVWKPASGEGREVQTVSSIKYTVGRSIKILGPDSTEVSNGKKFVTNQQISLKAEVLPATQDEPEWIMVGPDKADPVKGPNFSFTPSKAGTYTVSCTVGSATKTLNLHVADAVVEVSFVNKPDRIVVEQPVIISAAVEAIAGADLDYKWTCTSGDNAKVSENSAAGEATFIAREPGAYSVTCTVRNKVKEGDKVKYNKLGSGTIKIVALNPVPETTVKPNPEPKLQLICSTSSKNLSMTTDVTWTANWVKGFTDKNYSLEQLAYYWYAVPKDAPSDAPPIVLNAEPEAGNVLKMGPNALNKMGEGENIALSPGEYTIYCDVKLMHDDGTAVSAGDATLTDGDGKSYSAAASFTIFKSAVLTMSAYAESDTSQDNPIQNAGNVVRLEQQTEKQKMNCTLSVAWQGKSVPTDKYAAYTWTCDNIKTGSVTGDTILPVNEDQKNDRKLRLFSTDIPGTYKVRCVGTSYDAPADAHARTAELTIEVVAPEPSTAAVSDPAGGIPAPSGESVTGTRFSSILKSDSKISLSQSTAGTGVNVNGGVATGINRTGLTVGEILNSFEASSDQSVVVTDCDGTVRSDLNGPVVTGDHVQICDASGSVIEEVPVVIMGDVIGTGQLSLSQVVTLAKELKNPGELEGPYLDAGDWNGNAAVNLSDIVRQASEMKAAMNS